MKKGIKWLVLIGGSFFVLIIAILIIVPMFVDVQKYKPQIEKRASEALGRPLTLGGDLHLSLFPWIGLSFSDLHVGNPPGFKEKDLLSVKSFEVRVKLIPLLSKDIQVKRFMLKGSRIVLEKTKDGRVNWTGIGKPSKPKEEKVKKPEDKPREGLPIKSVAVGEFTITEGSIIWIDRVKGERKEISDVTLRLKDVSLDRPIHLVFSARLDGQPLSLDGDVGPLGKEPGKGTVPFDLAIKAFKQLDVTLKGKIIDPSSRQQFDLAIEVSPFSPRKLVTSLGKPFPVTTADQEVLSRVALKANLKGDPQKVSVSDGGLNLDESKLAFSVKAMDFSKPDIAFDLNLDKINLDRYLPPPSETKPEEEKKKKRSPASKQKKTDYGPLRRLVLDGTIRVGKLTARGAKMEDLSMKVVGKNGLFHLDPFSLKLYQGNVSSKGTFDVRQAVPKSAMNLQTKGIQAGPLLRDLTKKDFLEGALKAVVAISMTGDNAERIKSTLNGKGDLLFRDGAIKGIDLPGMVRNVKATFGLAEKEGKKPQTDFSELHAPFTITNGVVNTSKTTLLSPLLRVMARGKANLLKETLDFRVEPKFVTTLKGQGDTGQRSGIMVPVLVTGNFSSPKFRPDLKGMLKQKLEKGLPKPSELKEILKGPGKQNGETKTLKEKGEELLKGLPFGK